MTRPARSLLTARQETWLAHLGHHGPLASDSLIAVTRPTHRCKDTGLRVIQALREEGYLHRPKQQDETAKACFNPDVYDLTATGHATLNGLGRPASPYRPRGHWWHRFFVSSVSSAFAIAANARGIPYLGAEAILRSSQKSLAIPVGPGARLIPDQLFALRLTEGYRLIALEFDRGTEPLSSTAARKSVATMIRNYVTVQQNGLHKAIYGVRSPLLLLTVFSHPARTNWFLEQLADQPAQVRAGLFAQTYSKNFPRQDSLQALANHPFLRAGLQPFDIWQGGAS